MWPIDSIIEKPCNGYFLRDLIVFNGLNAGGHVSKGFIFQPPDFNNAQISELNDFQDQISILLASLSDNQRLQVQWFCDSDYQRELLRYNEETKRATNTWTRRSRNERFLRYWKAMQNRQLRRQRLIFYISRSIDTSPAFSTSRASLTNHYEHLLDQLQQEFEQVCETLTGVFSGQGARIIPMTDADHYQHYTSFLNPSLADRLNYDAQEAFDPSLSIQENCWRCEGNGQTDFGFWMDGHYHSTIVLTRWPKMTFPGIIHRLTNLRLLDYTITVNVDPIPIRKEILKEEKAHERLAGDFSSEKKLSLLTVMQKKERKIAALMQGHTLPFNALFVVRVWHKTKAGLSAKATAIKNAINSMNSAQYFESSLPSTTKKLFFQTWPGWLWGKYEHRKMYAEHRYLADMLPVIRLAVCRCFLGIALSSFRICSIRHMYGPSFLFTLGRACRYPGGVLFSKIFFSVFQCMPVSLRTCLLLVPSINIRRRISAQCSISVNILHVNLEVPHFSTAAPLSATRRTFQPPFTAGSVKAPVPACGWRFLGLKHTSFPTNKLLPRPSFTKMPLTCYAWRFPAMTSKSLGETCGNCLLGYKSSQLSG